MKNLLCLWKIYPVYEMSYLWNVLSMKCPIYEMSYLWNVLFMKCSINDFVIYKMFIFEMCSYEMTEDQQNSSTNLELSQVRFIVYRNFVLMFLKLLLKFFDWIRNPPMNTGKSATYFIVNSKFMKKMAMQLDN